MILKEKNKPLIIGLKIEKNKIDIIDMSFSSLSFIQLNNFRTKLRKFKETDETFGLINPEFSKIIKDANNIYNFELFSDYDSDNYDFYGKLDKLITEFNYKEINNENEILQILQINV